MDVRSFIESDRESLQELYIESRKAAFPWQDTAEFLSGDFEKDTEGEVIWVAVEQGIPVGFVSTWVQENFIHNLFVHPNYLRREIGSALLAKALDDIGRPARLKCGVLNCKALAFYHSAGWEAAGEGDGNHGRYVLLVLKTGK
ncbi:MAG: GNAT superfamily N-acetyltransferase [Verrucomicrobiales bacterium]|jgi:GNAT superfamily N-acetyltransferase